MRGAAQREQPAATVDAMSISPRLLVGIAFVALLVGLPAPATAQEGPWVWPTTGSASDAGTVVRGFSPPLRRWSAGHRGVDLLAAAGSTIRAAGAGIVSFAGVVADRGVVVVRHRDGTRTTYEPVRAQVRVGGQVQAGAPLGLLESTGGHCAPAACLHWGRLRGSVYLDPLALVGQQALARLLPIWTWQDSGRTSSSPGERQPERTRGETVDPPGSDVGPRRPGSGRLSSTRDDKRPEPPADAGVDAEVDSSVQLVAADVHGSGLWWVWWLPAGALGVLWWHFRSRSRRADG